MLLKRRSASSFFGVRALTTSGPRTRLASACGCATPTFTMIKMSSAAPSALPSPMIVFQPLNWPFASRMFLDSAPAPSRNSRASIPTIRGCACGGAAAATSSAAVPSLNARRMNSRDEIIEAHVIAEVQTAGRRPGDALHVEAGQTCFCEQHLHPLGGDELVEIVRAFRDAPQAFAERDHHQPRPGGGVGRGKDEQAAGRKPFGERGHKGGGVGDMLDHLHAGDELEPAFERL